MKMWVAVAVVGALSYGLRVVPVMLVSTREVPARLDQVMRGAGTAALAALLTTHLLQHRAHNGDPSALVALLAVAVTFVLAARARSMLVAVVAGLAVFTAVSLGLGLAV